MSSRNTTTGEFGVFLFCENFSNLGVFELVLLIIIFSTKTLSLTISIYFSSLSSLKRDLTKEFAQELVGKMVDWGKKETPLAFFIPSVLVSPTTMTEKVH